MDRVQGPTRAGAQLRIFTHTRVTRGLNASPPRLDVLQTSLVLPYITWAEYSGRRRRRAVDSLNSTRGAA
jgi:hypothetical protein